MNRIGRAGVVVGGWAAGLLAAFAAVYVRQLMKTDEPEAPGMYAFGDGLLFIAVFGVVAMIATGLVLYRRH